MNLHSKSLPLFVFGAISLCWTGCNTSPVDQQSTSPPADRDVSSPHPGLSTAGDEEFWELQESRAVPGPRAIKTSGSRGGVISRWASARRGEVAAPSEPTRPESPPLNVEKLRGDVESAPADEKDEKAEQVEVETSTEPDAPGPEMTPSVPEEKPDEAVTPDTDSEPARDSTAEKPEEEKEAEAEPAPPGSPADEAVPPAKEAETETEKPAPDEKQSGDLDDLLKDLEKKQE